MCSFPSPWQLHAVSCVTGKQTYFSVFWPHAPVVRCLRREVPALHFNLHLSFVRRSRQRRAPSTNVYELISPVKWCKSGVWCGNASGEFLNFFIFRQPLFTTSEKPLNWLAVRRAPLRCREKFSRMLACDARRNCGRVESRTSPSSSSEVSGRDYVSQKNFDGLLANENVTFGAIPQLAFARMPRTSFLELATPKRAWSATNARRCVQSRALNVIVCSRGDGKPSTHSRRLFAAPSADLRRDQSMSQFWESICFLRSNLRTSELPEGDWNRLHVFTFAAYPGASSNLFCGKF